MLNRAVGIVLRKPKTVLLVVLLLALAGGVASGSMTKGLTAGGYTDDSTESARVGVVLEHTFKQGDPNLSLLVSDPRGVDSPAVVAAGQALTKRLSAEPGVKNVGSYWSLNRSAALRSKAGDKALVMGTISGDFDAVLKRVKTLAPAYTGTFQGMNVQVGGSAQTWNENIKTATKDVSRADGVVFPVLLIALVFIFGSLVAALLPLAVAFATMLLAMLALWGVTSAIDSSSFVINIATFLGLGLAVDYSLLIVSRYREELGRGTEMETAIRNTMRTAGRTVIFSAITVAIALSAVLVFPFTIFTSLASAAVVTAVLAAASAFFIVPALLVILGPRVDKLRIIRRKDRPAGEARPEENGFWHRLAMFVMRHPIPVALGVLALVVLLGLPSTGMRLRLPDEQVLPKSAQAAQVAKVVRTQFNSEEQQAIQVVAQRIGDPKSRGSDIAAYAAGLSKLPNVARVDALTGSYTAGQVSASPNMTSYRFLGPGATYLSVVPKVDGYSKAGTQLVRDVRATKAPFRVEVGGVPAVSVDTFDTLYQRIPIALAILAIGMFILLYLLTGSVVLPIIAIVLTTLSLSATFGALVFIFQDGHLKWLFGDFVVTGSITWTVPILLFSLAFGLSMDYQVFMLSRFREEYARTGDNTSAVATGLERTGKVVSYAAILISLVFLVWVTSGLSYTKAVGIGLALAIMMDATLVRGALLPATMRLVGGRVTWWAPGPLRRLHARIGIHDNDGEDPARVPLAGSTVRARAR